MKPGLGARLCPRCGTRVDERRGKFSAYCLSCGQPLNAAFPSDPRGLRPPPQRSSSGLGWVIGLLCVLCVLLGTAIVLVASRGPRERPALVTSGAPLGSSATLVDAGVDARSPEAGVFHDPAATLASWVLGPLTGRDNAAAAFRRARVIATGGGHSVTIDNQFHFTCQLRFDDDGRPSRLEACVSAEGWSARPSSVSMSCQTSGSQETCTSGNYNLVAPGDVSTGAARFQIVRRIPP